MEILSNKNLFIKLNLSKHFIRTDFKKLKDLKAKSKPPLHH